MKAMLLERPTEIEPGSQPLRLVDLAQPAPKDDEILIRVKACGVCRTELDEIEGRIEIPQLPIILGHQIAGEIVGVGTHVEGRRVGERVGVGWIAGSCGDCGMCRAGDENLCAQFRATGLDRAGGYAEFTTVKAAFALPIPEPLSFVEAAPLLCAGAIGYRSLRLTGLQGAQRLGLTGFGASAQLVLRVAKIKFPDCKIFVFARDAAERALALKLGANWAGGTADSPPENCHAIIDTTPAWSPPLEALRHLLPGGRLVINAIRKAETDKHALLSLSYEKQMWMEREVKSVANVTRQDIGELLALSALNELRSSVQEYPLASANEALQDLKFRPITGGKVLVP